MLLISVSQVSETQYLCLLTRQYTYPADSQKDPSFLIIANGQTDFIDICYYVVLKSEIAFLRRMHDVYG